MLFVAALALVIVGPKDMPKLMRMMAGLVGKVRRIYTDIFSAVKRLEREVDLAAGGGEKESWRELVPESARNLPPDFSPGSMTAEQHQRRRTEFERAGEIAKAKKENTNAQASPRDV